MNAWSKIFLLMLGLFLVQDFFPTVGPPHFRYTGSDPGRDVINLGYPIALFIVDSEVKPRLVVGPSASLCVQFQIVVLGVVGIVAFVLPRI